MAGLARRLAPAAALGGLAVVIVGVADPAIASHTSAAAAPDVAAPEAAAAPQAATPEAATPEAAAPQQQSDQSQAEQPATTCANGETATGDAYTTPWGPVQVQATVADGTVCEVHAVAWPSSDGRSQQINAYAIPQLDAAATASPTSFDYVSGATYTSEGYHLSLQSILDAL